MRARARARARMCITCTRFMHMHMHMHEHEGRSAKRSCDYWGGATRETIVQIRETIVESMNARACTQYLKLPQKKNDTERL